MLDACAGRITPISKVQSSRRPTHPVPPPVTSLVTRVSPCYAPVIPVILMRRIASFCNRLKILIFAAGQVAGDVPRVLSLLAGNSAAAALRPDRIQAVRNGPTRPPSAGSAPPRRPSRRQVRARLVGFTEASARAGDDEIGAGGDQGGHFRSQPLGRGLGFVARPLLSSEPVKTVSCRQADGLRRSSPSAGP